MIKDKFDYNYYIDKLNKAADAYYNSENPIMSDMEYDLLLEEIQQFEKNTGIIFSNSPTQKIGASVLSKLKKIQIIPKPMLSLDKCHSDEEVAAFAGKHTMIAMIKLDGLSVRIKYNNGKLMSANTRGNGVEGTDITEHIKQFQNVPLEISYQKELIVDGEAIIKISDFKEINKNNEFKNPRNAAAGALNVLDTQLVKDRKLSFIAWDVIVGSNYKLLSEKLTELQSYGFEIVYFITDMSTDEIKSVNNIIMSFKDEYPCDGVVWKFNDTEYGDSLGQTSHHFKNGIAWKPEIKEYETEVKDIEWTMGRTGQLTPVLIYDDINIDGSVCNRASLHNITTMTQLMGGAYPGQKVFIYKANEIIPQVSHAQEDNPKKIPCIQIPSICPYCGGKVEIHKDNDTEMLYCSNPNCTGKLVNKLDHFCGKKGLDIKGLSKATLEKLIAWEWVSCFADIYELEKYKIIWIDTVGFGDKSVRAILTAIEESKNTTLEKFIAAIGIPLIGNNVAKEICKHVSTYKEFRKLVDEKFNFYLWDTFGPEKCVSILKYDYTEADKVAEYLNISSPEVITNDLNGLTVCITGSLTHYKNRNELKTEIENKGGHVTGSVSGKTSLLINNDVTSNSNKNLTAKKFGIPILTEEDFIEKYLH